MVSSLNIEFATPFLSCGDFEKGMKIDIRLKFCVVRKIEMCQGSGRLINTRDASMVRQRAVTSRRNRVFVAQISEKLDST